MSHMRGILDFLELESYFCHLRAHTKCQNCRTTTSGRELTRVERKKRKCILVRGGDIQIFRHQKLNIFCEIGPHAKFQNHRIIHSRVMSAILCYEYTAMHVFGFIKLEVFFLKNKKKC